jgi:hypothetical protein
LQQHESHLFILPDLAALGCAAHAKVDAAIESSTSPDKFLRTCRTYDCRVFPAAGIEPDDDKRLIAEQASRWSFTYLSDAVRTQHDAVRSSAVYLREHRDMHPEGNVPATATQLAVAAIGRDELTGRTRVIDPEPEAVRVALSRRT